VVLVLDDVVNVQDVVVDDPFHQVEQPPAERLPADEGPGGPRHVGPLARLPQQGHAGHGRGPGEGVEQPVPEHVDLDVPHARRRQLARQHLVRLQDLVEHDPVHEPAQPDAQERGGGDQRAAVDGLWGRHVGLLVDTGEPA
jgi:hypothetical protein